MISMGTIGVVIPAYNEAKNLGRVLEVVCSVEWLAQIVVVDDGSQDATIAVAREYAARDRRLIPLRLAQNQGKAAALLAGVCALSCKLVIFLDADLIGLRPYHLSLLCQDVQTDARDMSVAVFRDGGFFTDAAQCITPCLSGQRCLSCLRARQALETFKYSRYGVETGLTRFAQQQGWCCHHVAWHGVTHTMKEQKMGVRVGLGFRWQMYSQILGVLLLTTGLTWNWMSTRNVFFQRLSSVGLRPFFRRMLGAIALLLFVLWFLDSKSLQARNEFRLQDLASWRPETYKRLLIFAPHPDDEVLAAGGILGTLLETENPPVVRVVIATNGDASLSTALLNGYDPVSGQTYRQLAALRQQESLAALAAVGVAPEQVEFWGFPDKGLEKIWQYYWEGDKSYRSPYSRLSTTKQAINSSNDLSYNSDALLNHLRQTLADFQPDAIILPHPQDGHSDHRTLANFIMLAVALNDHEGQSALPDLYAYVMWLKTQLRPWSMRLDRDVQSLPLRFSANTADWLRFDLPELARENKVTAVQAYKSQARPLRTLMRSAGSNNELFNRLWQHRVPRLAEITGTPDENWWSVSYEAAWRRSLPSLPFSSPTKLWSAADGSDLWLTASLPNRRLAGVSYYFHLYSSGDAGNSAYVLPASERQFDSAGRVYLSTRLRLSHSDAHLEDRMFMVALETRAPGGVTLARSCWYLLYIEDTL